MTLRLSYFTLIALLLVGLTSPMFGQFTIDAYITAPTGSGPMKATCANSQSENSWLSSRDPSLSYPASDYLYYGQSVYNCELLGPEGLLSTCTNVTNTKGGSEEAECTIVWPNPTSGTYQVIGLLAVQPWFDSDEVLCGSDSPYLDPLGFEDATLNEYNGQNVVIGTNTFNCTTLSSMLIAESQETYNFVAPPVTVSVSPSSVSLSQGGTQEFTATVNNASNTSVIWTASPQGTGTISSSGFYIGPAAITAQQTVTVKATSEQDTTKSGTATVTLTPPPLTLIGVSPPTWTAGNPSLPITITGSGFNSSTQVTITSPSWVSNPTLSFTSTATPSSTSIQGTVNIPANPSNTSAQSIGVTLSATLNGVNYTTAPYTVTITPVAYNYAITLQSNTSSLTYGYSSTITPVITCKTSSGAACAVNVSNPQQANFKILSGVGLGTLSNTSNASSTTFTDTALIPYPSQNVTVQGCASVAPTVCATTNFSIPATTITLNPPTMASPLTGGRTQAFTASIQNEGTATGLTWTLTPSPSSAAPGTLTSATTTITQQGSPASGTSGPNTYTAPNPIAAAAAVTLNACMTSNTSICATPVLLQLPGFSITATNNNPAQTALSLGHSMSYTVNAAALDGFGGSVGLSVSGLPAGVTGTFSPASINTSGNATLTLTSAYNTTKMGTFPITVTGTGGGVAQSSGFALTTRPLQYKGACGVQ